MDLKKDRIEIFSDVSERDGIGVEVIRNNQTIIEIFRDDTNKTRTVTLFQEAVDLKLVEETVVLFKKQIPWDFIKQDNAQKEL